MSKPSARKSGGPCEKSMAGHMVREDRFSLECTVGVPRQACLEEVVLRMSYDRLRISH